MRAIYQAEHLIDAHLIRGRLQAEGIRAHVQGEWLTGALGELPVQGLLAVCVEEADLLRAQQLLEDWRSEAAEEVEEAEADREDGDPGAPDAGGATEFLA